MTPQHQTLPSTTSTTTSTTTRTGRRLRRWTPLLAAVLLAPTLAACGPDHGTAAPSAPLTASVDAPSDNPSDTPTADDPSATPGPIPTETAAPLTPTRPTPSSTLSATTSAGSVAGSCTRTLDAYPQLDPGATGPAVSALQCFLNDADFGPVAVDGSYGVPTRAAVTKVEATFEGGPSRPGRVDAGFWVGVISRSLGDGTLKSGSKGADVTTLQRALRAAGAKLAVDGTFGAETKKAVETLQAANRIGVDGVVGEETLFLLKSGATIG
ncbi:peptidoglycan-binding domain-containing protein [Intrasporangium sp. YIM S08009]|uniref:peptidoglycan-binding domain-containing protein n=1 Tax=Intrasporangium zincisolvens TaxID=3080018 RepID=UPI002B0600C3|nr:peptidoglycan-binding protein [Intrasporangium sp. YIM S08009]